MGAAAAADLREAAGRDETRAEIATRLLDGVDTAKGSLVRAGPAGKGCMATMRV